MELITKKEIEQLDTIQGETCISIFIPTHRAGEAVLQGKDALHLKNQLKHIKNKLEQEEMGPREVDTLLAPIKELLDDSEFWRHQSDGLAIFRSDSYFEKYTLPIHFEAFNYVANGFYAKPLLPMFTGDGTFYVLALELETVKLYECTRHSIVDVVIDDLVPSRMEDRVGYDYEQKSLQYKSGADAHGRAMYHGHAGADRNRNYRTQFTNYRNTHHIGHHGYCAELNHARSRLQIHNQPYDKTGDEYQHQGTVSHLVALP